MVHSVARSTVDDWRVGHVLAIVDEDCPHVDEDEQRNIGELLKREDEWEKMIRHRLKEPVDWMERVRGERCWHDPLVVRLVKCLVYRRMVEAPMNEVDQEIGEEQEEGELDPVVQWERRIIRVVVQFGVSPNVDPEGDGCQCGHADHSGKRLLNLHLHLVLEKLGVLEDGLVEDQPV